MTSNLVPRPLPGTRRLVLIARGEFKAWLRKQPAMVRNWIEGAGFEGKAGEFCLLPSSRGALAGAVAGVESAELGASADLWHLAGLAARLPKGQYRIEPEPEAAMATRAALGWGLGAYGFARYKAVHRPAARLVWPKQADRAAVQRDADAVFLTRDLINTPAEDLGPAELAQAARDLAKQEGASCQITAGDKLLRDNYPLIHAVGRASPREPRLIDLRWGKEGAPRVTVVGKGVCFDSGGLDLKPEAAMKMMKKDMGGAAHALGLALMIMRAGLPVSLRVLVAAVENVIAGNAFKPLDVIRSRKGLTVEIGNTDAEGRLILADALAEASEEKPELLIDFATLTGAARVALGPELPAMYCNDEMLAADILRHAAAAGDPVWRMPLWQPYRARLDSKIADIHSTSDGPFAGSVTAALFLKEFVGRGVPWVHFDIFAWNPAGKPGRPEGGEAQTLRALFALIAERYGAKAASA